MVKVFLSYRHEDNAQHPDHQERVKELGEKLRAANLEVILDQFYLKKNPGGPNEGWPKWSEDRVKASDKILIIASGGYFECWEGKQPPGTGLGAACEVNVIRNALLYKTGYNTAGLRVVYFDKQHISEIPDSLYQINRFDINNPSDVENLIAWLGGTTAAAPPAIIPTTIKWPAAITGHQPDLANREKEFNFIIDLLAGKTSERAVFFEAASNRGKTTLVSECLSYARQVFGADAVASVDFKGNPSRDAAVETISIELASFLPNFSKAGSHPRDLRTDLRALTRPILLSFDTYEQASPQARELIQNLLLADLEKTPSLRIVIAGQEVPDYTKTLWAKSVRAFTLGPILDASPWAKFIQSRHPSLKQEEIKVIATAARGEPGVTRTLLESFAQTPGM